MTEGAQRATDPIDERIERLTSLQRSALRVFMQGGVVPKLGMVRQLIEAGVMRRCNTRIAYEVVEGVRTWLPRPGPEPEAIIHEEPIKPRRRRTRPPMVQLWRHTCGWEGSFDAMEDLEKGKGCPQCKQTRGFKAGQRVPEQKHAAILEEEEETYG